jgi:hypothetical protein
VSRLFRGGLLLAIVMSTVMSTVMPPGATAAQAAPPTAAVAMGDSFISGEGAESYQPVVDAAGVTQNFPGWAADNRNPYFCHRSGRASLHQATLPGIQARFNLACSGAQPHDIVNPSGARDRGRGVASQLDQLRAVGRTHDIDLVLVGLGSNNSSFTFGKVASQCVNRFIAAAWVGWWEVWTLLEGDIPQQPCTNEDLATQAQIEAATKETGDAVARILATLREIDADGRHRIVLQDYTNPLPQDLHPMFHQEDRRDDSNDKFRALGGERYARGCPVHRASLAPGHYLSSALGAITGAVAMRMRREFPGADVVYLNVQRAFDGARLCETDQSPAGTLVTPIRLMGGPDGNKIHDIGGYDKIRIQKISNVCATYYQTCQESWHPNAEGHAVLGRCLSSAAAGTAAAVSCRRQPDGSVTVS